MRNFNEFYQYMLQFYGPGSDLYPEYNFTVDEIVVATAQYINSGADFAADSWDREQIRDLIIDNRALIITTVSYTSPDITRHRAPSLEEHSPYATVNS